MMNLELLFEKGTAAGLTDMEAFAVQDETFSCKVFEQEVDTYAVAATQGLSFRGVYQGRMGYTYTEQLSDEAIDFLIDTVIGNALLLEKDENEELFEGSLYYEELPLYDEALEPVSAAEKIQFLKETEAQCRRLDPRVKSVNYCLFANGKNQVTLKNTKGLDLNQASNYAYCYLSVLVSENGENKTEGDYLVSTDFTRYQPQDLAKKVVEGALAQLGASMIPSGNYPILMKNKVAGSLLEAMSGSFSAESVHKDLSRLKGKLNEVIGAPIVSIMDDPHLPAGLGSASFDGEGVATYQKSIVEGGRLLTYLHSLTTARIFQVRPTGNGFRSGYKSAISISPSNMFIQPGKESPLALAAGIQEGIYLTDVQGLHAGLNSISGDFSLSASGFMIRDGKLAEPIHEFTVGGNFFDLLLDIEAIGSDLEFGASNVGSPTLRIKKMTVAGT